MMFKKIAGSMAAVAFTSWAGVAAATPILEMEGNNSFATAQDVNAFFDLSFDVRIEDENLDNTSTSIPHVEITGGGDDSFDIFTFDVTVPGSIAIFDIDCGEASTSFSAPQCSNTGDFFQSEIFLFDSGFNQIGFSDFFGDLDTGSNYGLPFTDTFDAFLQVALDPGTYYLEVGDFSGEIQRGQEYVLNISVGPQRAPAPAPGVLALFGLGLAGLGFSRRKRG